MIEASPGEPLVWYPVYSFIKIPSQPEESFHRKIAIKCIDAIDKYHNVLANGFIY